MKAKEGMKFRHTVLNTFKFYGGIGDIDTDYIVTEVLEDGSFKAEHLGDTDRGDFHKGKVSTFRSNWISAPNSGYCRIIK